VFGKFDALKLCDLEKKLQMTAARFLSANSAAEIPPDTSRRRAFGLIKQATSDFSEVNKG
jgi:hypothetical protein